MARLGWPMKSLQSAALLLLFLLVARSVPCHGADPEPFRILGLDRTANGLRIEWTDAGPGLVYTVQSRSSFGTGAWLTHSDRRPWPTAGTEWTIDLTGGPEVSFYRVLALPETVRGEILSVTVLPSLTLFQIAVMFAIAEIPVAPEHAVDVFQIVYETLDPWGAPTRASGALVLPQDRVGPLPLVSYQHGTLTRTNDAPSVNALERLPGVGFGSLGYAVAMPDYLGLGVSPGLHPYHHARSQATACVDLLRAVRSWCAANEVGLSGALFLAGYSQGGHATLALQREIEVHHADEFVVTASAPMAGAYDLSGVTTDDLLSGRPMPNPYYLLYLLGSYQKVYRLAGSLEELLAAPHDTTLPAMLDGNTSGAEINAAMPADPLDILDPALLDGIRTDPDHPVRVALRDNDLTRWAPLSPTRLYHCPGDQDVLYENSLVALDAFHARGATHVEFIAPDPTADHGGCALPSFLLAREWFDSLRATEP
jgi:hypothetical protein